MDKNAYRKMGVSAHDLKATSFSDDYLQKLSALVLDKESKESFYILCNDIFLKMGFGKYLESHNFELMGERPNNTENKFIFVSLTEGKYFFTNDDYSNTEYIFPAEWDTVKDKIEDAVKANPIPKKEPVEKHPENWNTPTDEQSDTNEGLLGGFGKMLSEGAEKIKNTFKNDKTLTIDGGEIKEK